MAGRILNFDKIITETVTVNVAGGPTWELRDDVPAGVMAVAFRVFDLERQLGPQQGQAGQQGAEGAQEPRSVAEERRLLDEHEAAALEAVTAIVQHSYPEVSREAVAEALSPSARGQVLAVFFPLLLRRFGPPSQSSASDAPTTTSSQTSVTPVASSATGSRQRASTAGVTRSRRR